MAPLLNDENFSLNYLKLKYASCRNKIEYIHTNLIITNTYFKYFTFVRIIIEKVINISLKFIQWNDISWGKNQVKSSRPILIYCLVNHGIVLQFSEEEIGYQDQKEGFWEGGNFLMAAKMRSTLQMSCNY